VAVIRYDTRRLLGTILTVKLGSTRFQRKLQVTVAARSTAGYYWQLGLVFKVFLLWITDYQPAFVDKDVQIKPSSTLPVKKVKVAHTRLPSVGFRSWSQFLAVSLQVTYVSHKPGGRLLLLSARPAVTSATLKRAATNFAAWWTEAQWVWTVCLKLLPDSITTAIWTQALLRLSSAANHYKSITKRTNVQETFLGMDDSSVIDSGTLLQMAESTELLLSLTTNKQLHFKTHHNA